MIRAACCSPHLSVRRVAGAGLALALALAAAPLGAQQDAKVPNPDPEIERKALQVAEGFEVNLFAADPLLAKPIQMNFDAAGRLWVATSAVYPQIKPGQKADDKVIVLEDTKGTGKADRVTVFARGLLIPTGIEPGDGGAYVADSTDLLHLRDTKGTGKADRRRVMLSGFGTEDTHHILHTLRWGPDGMLYFNQSTYIHSHVETPHGVRRLGGGGIWQFRPETMQLEVFLHGLINPWGHHFDRWGQSFATDGAGGEGINYVVPGGSYAWTPGATRIIAGLNPGSPKYCGCEIVSGRHLPPQWQGNIITNDFRGHRVCRFVLREDGSGFSAQEKAELIKTNHPAFRPVDVKMGPDGAIYIADWYNPIIQHGEVDFRDPRRDHTRGRIWRVTYRGRPLVRRPKLVGASTASLLKALKDPEDWTRHHAKRVLKERGAKRVVPALAQWVKHLDPKAPAYEHHLLEALWTYQSLDVVEPKLLAAVLEARDHHARAAATRVIGYWHDRLAHPLEPLAARVADDHPQVRLEAVRALAQLRSARAAEVAMQALDRPVDKFLDYGIWLTARELQPYWLPALRKAQVNFGGNVRRLVFALEAVGSPGAVGALLELVKAGKVPADREEGVLALIGALGGPAELAAVFAIAAKDSTPPGRRVSLLSALARAARQRGVRPAGRLDALGRLLACEDETVAAGAARLAGLWRLEALRGPLRERAFAPKTNDTLRQAAVNALGRLGGPLSRDTLDELAGERHPQRARALAITALASLDVKAAARRAADLLAARRFNSDPPDVFTAFLQRKHGAKALAAALDGRKLSGEAAKVGIRTVRLSGRDAPELLDALRKTGGLAKPGPRVLSANEMRRLLADVARRGEPGRGEAVFRRKDQLCLKCHAIGGAGGQVGPDLASIGASAPVDYLIESILQPNKAIKEGYHSLSVTTSSGRIISGIKVRQTRTELILRDADDKEVGIPLKDIDETANGGSLMPEGLADTLTRAELVDLVRFLSELGKVGPYALGKARLVRRWQVLEPTGPAYGLLYRTSFSSAAGNDPTLTWTPAYSKVSGVLPLGDLPSFRMNDLGSNVFIRCQLDASTGGKIKLLLNSPKGVRLWLDTVPVEARAEIVLDLPAGVHALAFAVDLAKRSEGLRCELADVPGSKARVRIVGGK
jgi:putative heme-binding domain-containing protein